ncbi:type II 3-dehydroquinate dehydratase [uncultured Porphyromonas sp.]|uniref:type II 3-dehydroquinate dehydratase n=1 Tax=uncultured Porphyromonas sp. TaxID=159274 RepID=UPI0026192AF3|nr:type II 3-dehydroquinate dehydratase [uncultured Porphyromonas sp.]
MDTVSKEQMWIEIINGPNLARLGQREPVLYGRETMEDCLERLHAAYDERLRLTYFQSHHEGGLIERLYELQDQRVSGIVLNAGAYTHTSLALADALRATQLPAIEVHLSQVYQREPIRQSSLIAPACRGVITGLSMDVYRLGIEALIPLLSPRA